jgi:glyoxylase-like metal-dependent hydrolase (beta-lactamase superfamily II)
MTSDAWPSIRGFFDETTNSVSYLVWDPATGDAAIIDPLLAFDPATGKASTAPAAALLGAATALGLRIIWLLETHVHADHLSAAAYLKAKTGAPIAIGEHVGDVQRIFRPIFDAADVSGDGAEFDRLLRDGERLPLGQGEIEVLYTPGHTPACVSYRIGDTVFVGDTLFMPDYGTARADFPGGDARQLYRSIRRLLDLPPATRLFMCHDYKAPGRDNYAWETTVAAERDGNVQAREGITEDRFVAQRQARDTALSAPRLLLPSIQVNMRAGGFPPAEANGRRHLRIPVTLDGATTIG